MVLGNDFFHVAAVVVGVQVKLTKHHTLHYPPSLVRSPSLVPHQHHKHMGARPQLSNETRNPATTFLRVTAKKNASPSSNSQPEK